MTLTELTEGILEMVPADWRFRPEDSALIQRHKDFLLSLTDELVQGFYDTLFAHPNTRAVFREGERPEREESLRRFWLRVAQGPHDINFWKWMAFVGVLHVRRRVKNPMMLAAWGYILGKVQEEAAKALPPEEALVLTEAMTRLAKTAEALTAEGYLEALAQASGMTHELLDQIVAVHILEVEEQLRGDLKDRA